MLHRTTQHQYFSGHLTKLDRTIAKGHSVCWSSVCLSITLMIRAYIG